MTGTAPVTEPTPDPTAEIAHGIRDRVTVLANALAVIRLGGDPADALRLADRQIAALSHLADALHDPTRD